MLEHGTQVLTSFLVFRREVLILAQSCTLLFKGFVTVLENKTNSCESKGPGSITPTSIPFVMRGDRQGRRGVVEVR